MINKTIAFAITVIFALMTTTTLAFAAPTPNGQPFQQIQQQLTALQDQVDGFVVDFSDFMAQILAEAAARAAADTTLQTNIDAEAAARAAADTTLQTNIDAEAAARAQGDIDTLSAANQYTDSFFDVFVEVDLPCSDGQIPKRSSSSPTGWVCAPDEIGIGGGSSGRLIVVERSGPTTAFSADSPFRFSFAPCLSGEIVVGGGYRATPVTVNITSESSTFSEGSPGWFVNAYSPSGEGSITALAECATIAP